MDETKNFQTPTPSPKIKQPFLPKTASLQCKIHLGSLKTFSTQIFGHDGSAGRNEGHRGVQRGKVVTFFTHISSVQFLESADKDASISCVFSVYKVYSLTLLEPKSRSTPCDVHLLTAVWLFFPQLFWNVWLGMTVHFVSTDKHQKCKMYSPSLYISFISAFLSSNINIRKNITEVGKISIQIYIN